MDPLAQRSLHSPAVGRGRLGTHGILLGLTFLTSAIAGGLVWEVTDLPLDTWFDFLRPAVLLSIIGTGSVYAFWVLFILGCHEMGHYLACRYHGIPATLPFFLPGIPPLGSFGAVIRIRAPIPHRRALFDVAAAGPIAGFVITVPVLIAGVLQAEPVAPEIVQSGESFYLGRPVLLMLLERFMTHDADLRVNSLIGAGWVGLLVTSLNLFPVGQLDGGHAAYALSRRVHRALARTTLVALVGVISIQAVVYRQFPSYVLWFGILLWMRDRHPRLIDESDPLGPGRKLVALALALILVLSFIAVPIYFD